MHRDGVRGFNREGLVNALFWRGDESKNMEDVKDCTDAGGEKPAVAQQPIVRSLAQLIRPDLLAHCLPGIPYMMPSEALPIMDCAKCLYKNLRTEAEIYESLDDGTPMKEQHCYMFREQPSGDRCGQMKSI